MPLKYAHQSKTIPALLAVAGSVALALGIFFGVMSMTRASAGYHGGSLPLGGKAYVGGDTCFTCHADQPRNWSLLLETQPVTAPMTLPQVGAAASQIREVHLDPGAVAAFPQPGMDYVIKTERDQASLSGTLSQKPVLGKSLRQSIK